MKIYCVQCEKKVSARLTDGKEIYPPRRDLHKLPYWKCDTCGNHVGCHHRTDKPTRPLGIISTKDLRKARGEIHEILDPLWRTGRYTRKQLYTYLSKKLGRQYHTAKIVSMDEARKVWGWVKELEKNNYDI